MKKIIIIAVALTISMCTGICADSKKSKSDASALEAVKTESTYWLTKSSGVRHNSKCKFYQKSKGAPCAKDAGRPCKRCGG